MTITVLHTDLRPGSSRLKKFSSEWKPNITAFEIAKNCLGEAKAQEIEKELRTNDLDIMVSWYHPPTDAICEIGGVGTLLWLIADNTLLTISYRNENTTEEQEDELIKWTLKQGL